MPSNSNVILIGFMGSGKTTIGKALAEKLGYSFTDSDAEIEESEKMTISEIFKQKGEDYFRNCETNFLEKWNQKNIVLATGGGMPCFNDNMEILKQKGIVFFLEAPLGILINRIKKDGLKRPLALKDVEKLYQQRENTYLAADFKIDAKGEVEAICERVLFQFHL